MTQVKLSLDEIQVPPGHDLRVAVLCDMEELRAQPSLHRLMVECWLHYLQTSYSRFNLEKVKPMGFFRFFLIILK